jgi:dTDP-4-amino-4,6-dideoxygalactose transaminase
MPIVLPKFVERQEVVDRLREAEIQTTFHYPPAHLTSFYRARYPSVHLPRTEDFAERELTLPLHPAMDEADVERVAAALAKALAHDALAGVCL